MPRRRREIALAAVAYAGIVAALTWPLAAHLGTHWPATRIGCMHDLRLQAFMLAHLSRTLFAAPDQLPHAAMFAPAPWATYYGEAAFGALPIFLPIFLLSQNPILALNAVFFGGVVGTATALFAVARQWGSRPSSAFVGGAVLAASPWTVWTWGVTAPNFTVLWYWPWIVALAAREVPPVGRLAVLLGLQSLTSVYVAVGLFVPYGAVVAARGLTRQWAAALRLVTAATLGGAATILVLGPHLWVQRLEPQFFEQSIFPSAVKFIRAPLQPFGNGHATGAPAVCLALALAGGWLVRHAGTEARRRWALTVVWLVAGLLLSFPRVTEWHGYHVPTLLGTLERFGVAINGARDARRMGEATLIAISLLTALGIDRLAERWSARHRERVRRALAAVVAAGIGWHLVQPLADPPWGPSAPAPGALPLFDASQTLDWPFWSDYATVDGPLLELPIDPISHASALQRAISHRHPILNGTHSYYPVDFGRRMQQACALPAPAAVAALRANSGVALIAIDLDNLLMGFLHPVPFGCLSERPSVPNDFPRAAALANETRRRWEEAATADRADLPLVRRVGNRLLFRVGAPGAS